MGPHGTRVPVGVGGLRLWLVPALLQRACLQRQDGVAVVQVSVRISWQPQLLAQSCPAAPCSLARAGRPRMGRCPLALLLVVEVAAWLCKGRPVCCSSAL